MGNYIQSFIAVCQNVFKKFVGLDITVGRPFFVDQREAHQWDLSAVIGLTGEVSGAVVISLKTPLALRLTERLTGAPHEAIDEDVVDAVGEVVNIVAGNVKRDLEADFRPVISLPSIVQGRLHQIAWPAPSARVIRVPFEASGEEFALSVSIEAA